LCSYMDLCVVNSKFKLYAARTEPRPRAYDVMVATDSSESAHFDYTVEISKTTAPVWDSLWLQPATPLYPASSLRFSRTPRKRIERLYLRHP
jgi:hypothetical protein